MKNRTQLLIGSFLIFLSILACSSSSTPEIESTSVQPTQDIETETQQPSVTDTPKPTPTSPLPTPTQNPNIISAGTYMVGKDIMPNIYYGEAGVGLMSSCYWERLSDLTGSFESIIANGNAIGQFYIEVKESDVALNIGCEIIPLDKLPAIETIPDELGPGTFLIGRDIKPGIYQGVAGYELTDSCYWERLKNVAGGFDAIHANDNAVGQFYVEVKETDFAFSTACELAPMSLIPAPENYLDALQPGTYIVNRDILPGTYQGQAGSDLTDSCYWERIKNVSGDFGAILANDNAVGQFYIQVANTDFAVKTSCELIKVE